MKRLIALLFFLVAFVAPASAATLLDGSQINRVWPFTNNGSQTGLKILGSGTAPVYTGTNGAGVPVFHFDSDGKGALSGSLVISAGPGLVTLYGDATNRRVGIKTLNPKTTLEVIGTASGSELFATQKLATSGSLAVGGSVLFKSLPSCAFLQSGSNGALSCGSFAVDTNTRYGAGQGITLTGTGFSLNASLSGTLIRFTTVSGSTVFARDQLRSSGTLIIETTGLVKGNLTTRAILSGNTLNVQGQTTLHSGLQLISGGFISCGVLTTDTSGNLACTAGTSVGTKYRAGQGLTLTGTGFTLNASLSGTLIRFATVSGSTVYAKTRLASSGSLVVTGPSYLQGTVFARSIVSCSTLQTTSSGALQCGVAGSTVVAGKGLNLNSGLLTLNASISGSLVRFTTVSGSTVFARNQLRSSGSLIVAGLATLQNGLNVTGTVAATDFTCSDCLGVGDLGANSVDASELVATTVSANSYGTALNIPAFTVDADGRLTAASVNTIAGLTGTHVTDDTFDFVDFEDALDLDAVTTLTLGSNDLDIIVNSTGQFEIIGTASGRIIHAQNELRSSGSLVVEGNSRILRFPGFSLCGYAACAVGTGSSIHVTSEWNGFRITAASLCAGYTGTTGTMTVQVRNLTQAKDLFSTAISIDSAERCSSTAAAAAVINASNNTVATDDVLVPVVTGVHTTPAKDVTLQLSAYPP